MKSHPSEPRFATRWQEPVTVRTKEPRDWHRVGLNYVCLEPADARIVRNDRFSDVTVGTQAILLMYPLHFGRFGGRSGSPSLFYGVMVLYVVIGVSPFVLMVTGLLMYWNRSLSKKWKRARAGVRAKALVPAGHAAQVRTSNPSPRT